MTIAYRGNTRNCLTIVVLLLVAGCDVSVSNIRPIGSVPARTTQAHEDLDSALWMQTSAEYAVITAMIYELAWQHVEMALRDERFAAWPPQTFTRTPTSPDLSSTKNGQPRPPAVILDVDETVLDNSAFQVQQILDHGEYDKNAWHAFCQRAESLAVPGARQFVTRCRNAGVEVFFVTNRDVEEKQATCQNLSKLDILAETDEQHLMCKGELSEWTSDKESRRQAIAASYRVLALLGDDLNDFVSVGFQPTAGARKQLAIEYGPMWGQGWFMLPNANYGGWERAIYDWNDALPRPQKLRKKLESLRRPLSSRAAIE